MRSEQGKRNAGPKACGGPYGFPSFRLKPAPEVRTYGYGTLNIEGYGGMIVSTWMDRPLSLAGKIVTRTEDPFQPKTHFVDFGRPLLTMASLAIHMNREVNDGYKWNKQKDILPLAALIGEDEKRARSLKSSLQKSSDAVKRIFFPLIFRLTRQKMAVPLGYMMILCHLRVWITSQAARHASKAL